MIEHSLKNTGRKTIETTQYNHNFFVIDQEVVGPGMAVHFAFVPKPTGALKDGVEIRGQEITYSRDLQAGEGIFWGVEGFGDSPTDYDIRIENRRSGAGVRITGDRPLAKLNFWSIRTVASPEPYLQFRIEPGHESKWNISYDFYTLPAADR